MLSHALFLGLCVRRSRDLGLEDFPSRAVQGFAALVFRGFRRLFRAQIVANSLRMIPEEGDFL